jgi:autotransporter-associated beta strand protein
LFFEALEERSLMALLTWTGAGADAKWSTGGNWLGGAAPQQDDNLIFPVTATSFTSVNDLAAGTRFRSVTISSSSYVINEATPDGDKITLLEGLVYNAPSGSAQFNVPIALGASQTFISANAGASLQLGKLELANLQLLTIDGRGDLDVEGIVSGTGGITKLGNGTLVLGKDNTFEGLVNVTQGAINLRANNVRPSSSARWERFAASVRPRKRRRIA